MSLEQLRHSLAQALADIAEARTHTATARELLGDYRRVVGEAQAQARPWLPRELAQAVEQLDANRARLDGVADLISSYESRL